MTDNRMSGLALIAASAGLILTLSLHPSGRISPAQVEQMVRKLIAVHSLALATLPIMFLGALGLARVLASPNRLSVVGLVVYGFAATAMLCGLVADGLVTPSLLREMVTAAPGTGDSWRTIFRYNDYLDMAFVRVALVATAAAIAMWSISIVRSATLPRPVGIYGLTLGVIVLFAVFSGVVPAEHAIGAIVLCQTSWFVIVGVLLWRLQEPVSHGG